MTTTERFVIDHYDVHSENERLDFPDRCVGERTLNRGTARVSLDGTPHRPNDAVRAAHEAQILPNTLGDASPVIDLSYPATGHFVDSEVGVYVDLYLGVAQKLVDEHHPVFDETIRRMVDAGLAFRREINTDDFMILGRPIEGVHASPELAQLVNEMVGSRFPQRGPFKTFFSNSGTEATEAAIKLAQLNAHARFLNAHGPDVLARVMEDLGIGRDPVIADIYTDYPFFVFACEGAFHGRTMGALSLTHSKAVHHVGYGRQRWVRHLPFNGSPGDLEELLDERPITEILDAPGGVAGVIASGKVPRDLAAMFAVECFQGEGGYRLADREWLGGIEAVCRGAGILFGVDEVQSFGRTGELFAVEHYGLQPDILWLAKGAVVGMTVARADLAEPCATGWHSNTFGGGKVFDVNMAYATLKLLTEHRDPIFENRTYLENSRIKGEYMRMRLSDLSARHPDIFPEFCGLGCMWGLTVRHREEIVESGWRMGLKLLGCGDEGELSRLRILLLTDVLTREIDEAVDTLDRVLTAVEEKHPDLG